ncbi:hypothetical protein [uncultured Treponema sp.]|uniref:hypothetical protein n=1 Tax=uncultured Treponema sp. TaxID=162155 RepID=UPI0025D6D944|nr:hypothetical protein [uncultured Treponema sp.]
MPAPQLTSFRRQSITNIYIGIDFGTSYTKVSYSYAPSYTPQIQTIKWNNENDSFFKKTILYIQNGRLYFDKPSGDSKEVKYFKYSIIDKRLKNNVEPTTNCFEEMCCVYYLAQVISHSINIIRETLHIINMDEIKVSINMGVPLENFYKDENKTNKGKYQDILEDAVLLAGGCKVKAILPSNQVLISNLDTVYSEMQTKKAKLKWAVNVYPELAAELLLYHKSDFVPDGVYAIIDIGGGTVDMALFQKMSSGSRNNAYMYCLAQKVLPYGIEILQNAPNTISSTTFKQEFSMMLNQSKRFMDVHYDQYKKIDVFFLGGGSSNLWYVSNIKNMTEEFRLERSGIPPLAFSRDIKDFIDSEEMLLQKNQRLIISQMLARHRDEIDSVKGFPDFYKQELRERPKDNSSSYEDILYERGSKYWD